MSRFNNNWVLNKICVLWFEILRAARSSGQTDTQTHRHKHTQTSVSVDIPPELKDTV